MSLACRYDDDDLGAALSSGAVRDLAFWKEIGHDPTVVSEAARTPAKRNAAKRAKGAAIPGKSKGGKGFAAKAKKR